MSTSVSRHDLVDTCLFKVRDRTGLDLSRRDMWEIVAIVFSTLFQLASDYDKITLSGILSITKTRSSRSSKNKKKFTIMPGTPVNAELNKDTPDFNSLIAGGKMTRRRLRSSTLQTEQDTYQGTTLQ